MRVGLMWLVISCCGLVLIWPAERLAALSKFPECLVLPISSQLVDRSTSATHWENKRANSKCVWSVAHTPKRWLASLVFRGRGVRGFWLLHFKFGVDSSSFLFEELFGGGNAEKGGKWGWIWQVFSHDFISTAQPEIFSKLAKWVLHFSSITNGNYWNWKKTIYFLFFLWFLWIDDYWLEIEEDCTGWSLAS